MRKTYINADDEKILKKMHKNASAVKKGEEQKINQN